jgi:SAM-dependent methyltransferase
MDVKEIDILGEKIAHHWYYSAKAKMVCSLLKTTKPTNIMDVGAGSGFFTEYLLQHTEARQAWCIDTSYSLDRTKELGTKKIRFARSLTPQNVDTVLLMDVLEHVDDDQQLLRDCMAAVPKETLFLISVPAFQFLWSGHDEFLEHRRRYTRTGLESVVAGAGLDIQQSMYGFGLVFPIAASIRMGKKLFRQQDKAESQLKNHAPFSNMALKLLCDIELPFMRMNRLAGLTVFCVAKKT